MKFKISEYPSSYLAIEFNETEKLITEKGSLIYCDGEYSFENKIEAKNYKNWIAKIFEGKSLTYNIYTAKENLKIKVSSDTLIFFESFKEILSSSSLSMHLRAPPSEAI